LLLLVFARWQAAVPKFRTEWLSDLDLWPIDLERIIRITSCAGGRHNMPRPCKLTLNLLTLKVVSESRVTWATSVQSS